jgi:ATPase subunit of ABC transporter with duplicated ATPase domains
MWRYASAFVSCSLAHVLLSRPHVVILDEPTNYLDRESLAALIAALKTFEGGLLVITHNVEFSESICSTFTVCLHKTDAHAVLQPKSGP